MTGKTVLILGGGVGGIVTANTLRGQLPPEHRVIVVDKRAEYVFTPSLLWVMVGWRRPQQITKSLSQILRAGVEFIQAEVQQIDPDGQAHTVARRIVEDIRGGGPKAEFDGLGFCWIETGGGSAGFASGEFYAEPDPAVPLPRSGRLWHWGKILFEKYWLGEGITRQASLLGMKLAARALGISVSL